MEDNSRCEQQIVGAIALDREMWRQERAEQMCDVVSTRKE